MLVHKAVVARIVAACFGSAFAALSCSSGSPGDGSTSTSTSDPMATSGSSSGQAGASGSSSGETATSDASPDGASTPDAQGRCSKYPGVDVTNVDAGAESSTWSCVEAHCGTQLATCAADCKCNDLILQAFFASHDLASANAAFMAALSSGSPPADAILVGVCLQLNQSNCPMWGSSNADAMVGD